MHRQWKDKGLVVITVSVDNPDEEDTPKEVEKFLKGQKATMSNFLLDEEEKLWQTKLGVIGVPCIYIFNRAGQIEEKITELPTEKKKETEKGIDDLVEKLLMQKGPK